MNDTQILNSVLKKLPEDDPLRTWIKRERELESIVQRAIKNAEPQIRKEIKTLVQEMKDEEMDEWRSDFDVIAVGKSKTQQERIKTIKDIIRELEREDGSAHIDKIVERAGKLGFDKDKAEAEIARLAQEQAIFEPVRYSGNYRTAPQ